MSEGENRSATRFALTNNMKRCVKYILCIPLCILVSPVVMPIGIVVLVLAAVLMILGVRNTPIRCVFASLSMWVYAVLAALLFWTWVAFCIYGVKDSEGFTIATGNLLMLLLPLCASLFVMEWQTAPNRISGLPYSILCKASLLLSVVLLCCNVISFLFCRAVVEQDSWGHLKESVLLQYGRDAVSHSQEIILNSGSSFAYGEYLVTAYFCILLGVLLLNLMIVKEGFIRFLFALNRYAFCVRAILIQHQEDNPTDCIKNHVFKLILWCSDLLVGRNYRFFMVNQLLQATHAQMSGQDKPVQRVKEEFQELFLLYDAIPQFYMIDVQKEEVDVQKEEVDVQKEDVSMWLSTAHTKMYLLYVQVFQEVMQRFPAQQRVQSMQAMYALIMDSDCLGCVGTLGSLEDEKHKRDFLLCAFFLVLLQQSVFDKDVERFVLDVVECANEQYSQLTKRKLFGVFFAYDVCKKLELNLVLNRSKAHAQLMQEFFSPIAEDVLNYLKANNVETGFSYKKWVSWEILAVAAFLNVDPALVVVPPEAVKEQLLEYITAIY